MKNFLGDLEERTRLFGLQCMHCLLKVIHSLTRMLCFVPLSNKLWVTNGVSERLLSAECRVFKSKIEKFYDEGKQNPKIDPLNTVTSKLLKFFKNNNTPIVLSMLYKLAVTAGYTQCRVECLFSAVTRVDSSHRRRHLIYRKACLAYLHENIVLLWYSHENIVLLWYSY